MALVKQTSYLSRYPSDAGGRIASLKSPTNSLYPSFSGYSQPILYTAPAATTPTFNQTDFTKTGAADSTPNVNAPTYIDPGTYADQIQNDALYQLALTQRGTEHDNNIAALKGGEQSALIRFGEIPDALGSQFGFDLTGAANDETRSLANQNTTAGLSTVAQLQRQREDQHRQIINTLAGRGLLRSGETGFQENRLQDSYQKAQYDSRNALMDYLAGLYSGYANNENSSYQSLLNQMNNAIARLLQNPKPTGTTTPPPRGPAAPTGSGGEIAQPTYGQNPYDYSTNPISADLYNGQWLPPSVQSLYGVTVTPQQWQDEATRVASEQDARGQDILRQMGLA